MTEVNPGSARFSHLMKKMIPKQFQQVTVSSLWPGGVLLKPGKVTFHLSNSSVRHMAVCLFFSTEIEDFV